MAVHIDESLISGTAPLSANQILFDDNIANLNVTTVQGAINKMKGAPQSAPSGKDYNTYRIRNIAIVDEIPTEMNDGDIALVYVKD